MPGALVGAGGAGDALGVVDPGQVVQDMDGVVLAGLFAELAANAAGRAELVGVPALVGRAAGNIDALYIRNQTLFVHLTSPALRADLSMMQQELVRKLNAHVGSQVIANIKFG